MGSRSSVASVGRGKTASPYKVQVLDRAIAILQALAGEHAGLALPELSRRMRLHRSTAYRLLAVLEQNRLVSRIPATGKYCLGFRFFEMANRAVSQMDLPRRARVSLEKLVAETGETGHLCILDQGEALYLEKVEGSHALRVPSTVGQRYPLHCGASGKALIAFLPEDELAELLKRRPLQAFTRSTITTVAQLKAELQAIRSRGYSIDDEEFEEGLKCLGAPVRDYSGRVVAAISIAGPAFRLTEKTIPVLARSVMQVAEQLSRELGYQRESPAAGERETSATKAG